MKYELLRYYDDIRRLAESKCTSKQDAEDLVSETFLAAYSYLHRGGVIDHPRTWLTHTFFHKFNSALRRKYNGVITVDLDAAGSLAEEEECDNTEEAAEVRRELLYLSQTTREVLIRYYYNGCSVADIAAQLNIPEGTVKSRLSAGREKIKKGLTHMTEKKNNIPGFLNVSWSGSDGDGNPTKLVEQDRIAQNLLMLAYEKPLFITELAEAIGIPTVYVEPIVEKLTDGELMVKTEGGKYYTDFIIYQPEDITSRFEDQKRFVGERFDRFWAILSDMTDRINKLAITGTLRVRQKRKLERYAVMHALQRFQLELAGGTKIQHPYRKDGGRWIAMGWYYPGGYDNTAHREKQNYEVLGGLRTTGGACDYAGAKFLKLFEFDTTLWDNPYRWWQTCGFDVYFKEIRKLLWCLYRNIPLEESGISNTMIESLDLLIERTGLVTRENGRVDVDIPVLSKQEHRLVEDIVDEAFQKMVEQLGEEYRDFLQGNMQDVPRHIKSIPEVFRYKPVYNYIVMSVVREAYDKGLHMADVDYCCPPCVLVYNE